MATPSPATAGVAPAAAAPVAAVDVANKAFLAAPIEAIIPPSALTVLNSYCIAVTAG